MLVAITTNEALGHLHPAVVRPGHCLVQIEIGPIPREEAARWLGSEDGAGPSTTLAELYALKARGESEANGGADEGVAPVMSEPISTRLYV